MSRTMQNEFFIADENVADLFRDFRPSTPKRSRLYDDNIENLKWVIECLNHLKNNEELTDKEFSVLTTRAFAIFVENEMTSAFNKVFVKSLKDLKGILGVYKDEWRK